MSLCDLLETNRTRILDGWLKHTFATYPSDSVRFLASHRDQFSNPVGDTIKSGLTAVFNSLVAGADTDRLRADLDGVIRLRSVQNFSAADAVGFILYLKRAVRESAIDHTRDSVCSEDFQQFDEKIDSLTLLAFDLYMGCREQVYDIRAREEKARSSKLLDRARQIVERHATGQEITLDDITPQAEGGERQ
jgi:hypothetical protein